MLLDETKRRISKFFEIISNDYKDFKKSQFNLKYSETFNPKNFFEFIDTEKKGIITEKEINTFLKNNAIVTTYYEIKLLLYLLRLNNMIDINLFKEKILKIEKRFEEFNVYPRISTYSDQLLLIDFFNKGLILCKDIIFYTDNIKDRYDFTLKDLMITIGHNPYSISLDDLYEFLNLNFTDIQDLFNLLNISNNSDNQIIYKDIENIFYFDSLKENNIKNKNIYDNMNLFYNNNNNNKEINLNEKIIETKKNIESEFINYISIVIDLLNNIEERKNQLVYRSDFNLEYLFKIFDNENKEFITKEDFKNGLKLFNINISLDVINLIFDVYNFSDSSNLNKEEFFYMMIPFNNKNYRDIIFKRNNNVNKYYFNINDLSKVTIYLIENLFKSIIYCENKIYSEKKNLSENIFDFFKNNILYKIINNDNQNNIEINQFYEYLKNSNIIIYLDRDFNLLCNRLDKKRKKYFTLDDFQDFLLINNSLNDNNNNNDELIKIKENKNSYYYNNINYNYNDNSLENYNNDDLNSKNYYDNNIIDNSYNYNYNYNNNNYNNISI